MRPILTNEERLRRKRERWNRQSAERRKAGAEFKTPLVKGRAHQRKTGVREGAELIISAFAMQVAERIFWRKRGFDTPPVTAGGVMR